MGRGFKQPVSFNHLQDDSCKEKFKDSDITLAPGAAVSTRDDLCVFKQVCAFFPRSYNLSFQFVLNGVKKALSVRSLVDEKNHICADSSPADVPQSVVWALPDSSGVSALTQQDQSWVLSVHTYTGIYLQIYTCVHIYLLSLKPGLGGKNKQQMLCPRGTHREYQAGLCVLEERGQGKKISSLCQAQGRVLSHKTGR